MPSNAKPSPEHLVRSLTPFFIVVALAGAVDALVMMHAHDLLAVYMTGNTSKLADALTKGLWSHASPLLCIVATFFVATTLAAWLGKRVAAWRATVILCLCAAGLAAASLLAGEEYSLLTICLIAAAMGVLNQVKSDQSGVTFITGTLVSVGRHVADWRLRDASLGAMRWLSFLLGACAGAVLDVSLKSAALAVLASVAALCALLCALPFFRTTAEE